jgi:hypothetical protein
MEFLGVLALEMKSSGWQRLEGRRLGERLGAPEVLFMGLAKRSWPEIVAHIPLTESSSGHLEFKMSHIRFDYLKSGCVAVGLFF